MDPAKVIGKIKEQVRMEHKCRRNYPSVWHKVADAETNRFYHQDEIDKQLKDKLQMQDLCPYEHQKDNHGQSYFISPEMHKSLLGTCRCGRPRRGLHMAKCLQRALNPHSPEVHNEQKDDEKTTNTAQQQREKPDVPRTSNSFIGFVQAAPSYRRLEQSMQYVSPTHSMPEPRITAAPYNVLIIG